MSAKVGYGADNSSTKWSPHLKITFCNTLVYDQNLHKFNLQNKRCKFLGEILRRKLLVLVTHLEKKKKNGQVEWETIVWQS